MEENCFKEWIKRGDKKDGKITSEAKAKLNKKIA
jgi:hypothetical protein